MRFGLATADISPRSPATMYGYVARSAPFAGIHDPLEFTAVVLEERGTRVLLGAGDLGAFPNGAQTDALAQRLASIVGCDRQHVLLNASHSHGAVYLPASAPLGFPFADEVAAARYWELVVESVVRATTQAVDSLHEGTVEHVVGESSIPLNRRKEVDGVVEMIPNPSGVTDRSLHTLVFKDSRGRLEAVGARLSCHPVATRIQPLVTADFVGAWRGAMKDSLEDVTLFFLQGAAGDARPRHTATADGRDFRALTFEELETLGRDLADETLRALTRPARLLGGSALRGSIAVAEARCVPRFARAEDLVPLENDPDPMRRTYARACRELLAAGRSIPDRVRFQVQTLWIDAQLAIVGLDAEPVAGLARRVEEAFAPRAVMVLGYSNGLVGYAPDATELARGGYETTSYLYAPWSGPFAEGVEASILPRLDLNAPPRS